MKTKHYGLLLTGILSALTASASGAECHLPCMPPAPDAAAALERMKREAPRRRAHTERPFLFVRTQLKYGLERDDYLHKWLDRPLMQDSSLAKADDPRHFINENSYRRMAAMIRFGGMDGAAFFPATSGRRDLFSRSLLPEAKLPVLVELVPVGRNPLETDLEMAGLAMKAPNAFRINGKIVLTRYPGGTPEYSRELRQKLRQRYGDHFLYLPYLHFKTFQPDRKLDGKTIERMKEELRTGLRAADGIFFSDRSSVWKRRFNLDFEQQVIIPILNSVYSEKEFQNKILGYAVVAEHSNSYRFTHTLDCTGTTFLRHKLEAARSLRPDFIVMTEWDEQNEHTHFRPTVCNSFSTQRIVRAYAALLAGGKHAPLPGDDLSIPNLIVSFRRNLSAGEWLEMEVANVPDGTLDDAVFRIDARLKDLRGNTVKTFSPLSLRGSALAESVWFRMPCAELLRHQVVRPEISVSRGGKRVVFSDAMAASEIRANWNMDYKWVKHPLRDLPKGIRSELGAAEMRPDGTLLLKGRVSSPKKLRSVEILEGSNVVYSHAKRGFPKEDGDTVILSIAHQASKKRVFNGTIALNHGVEAVKGARGVRFRDGKLLYRNVEFSLYPFSVYLAVKRKDMESGELIVDLPPVRGRIRTADLMKQGIFGIGGPDGSNLVVSRFLSQESMPEPLFENTAEFSVTVRPPDKKAVYSILAVDEDYGIYRGSVLSLYRPSNRTRVIHVFDMEREQVFPVEADENLLTDFEYRFLPQCGSVVPCAAGSKYSGILGGFVPLATGYGSGEAGYGNLVWRSLRADLPGVENQAPEYVRESDGSWSLQFRDCNYVSLPLHVVPPYCGFELELKVMPDALPERTQTLFSSGINGFNLTLSGSRVSAEIFSGNRFYRKGGRFATVRASADGVRAKEWNIIRVLFSGSCLEVEVNGISGRKVPFSGCLMLPRATALGAAQTGNRFFRGRIAGVKCQPR